MSLVWSLSPSTGLLEILQIAIERENQIESSSRTSHWVKTDILAKHHANSFLLQVPSVSLSYVSFEEGNVLFVTYVNQFIFICHKKGWWKHNTIYTVTLVFVFQLPLLVAKSLREDFPRSPKQHVFAETSQPKKCSAAAVFFFLGAVFQEANRYMNNRFNKFKKWKLLWFWNHPKKNRITQCSDLT